MPASATYEPIATATGNGSSGTITFSSISGYTDLKIILMGTTTSATYVGMRFNGDSSAVYSQTYLTGNGTTAASSKGFGDSRNFLHYVNNTSTTIPQLFIVDVFSYAGSTNKSSLIQASMDYNGSGSVERAVGLWRNTSAITSVSFVTSAGAFSTNFTATLYGIKNSA